MYYTAGHIAIAYAYVCDVYANALYKSHQKQHLIKIKYSVCVVHKQDTILDAVEYQ